MYEIVKKRNLTMKIITGIVILFVMTSILKLFIKEPDLSVDKELLLISNEINKRAPITVDSMTRLDNVQALTGNRLQYNYAITNADKDQIDTAILKSNTKQNMTNMIKTNPKAKYFRDNKIEILINYVDQKGVYICNLTIPSADY